MLLSRRSFLYIVVAASILLAPFRGVNAQLNESRQPVDMMILIDNSCSMFPQNQIVQGCDVWGNDPNFLRITGADLFLARLGFGEVNEDAYQLGVISFGDDPLLLSPLQPLSAIRDSLATKIANPKPQTATKIVPALQMAYDELANSPNRKLSNLPAIVLLTDGVPYPPQGQTEQDIEALVSKHSDTPLFIMLLEGQGKLSSDYERFIQFWETLATRTTNIFVYPIKDASQIEETYNSIIGQLQNTIPTKGIQISADKPLKIYVSSFLQKIVVTAVRTNRYDQGKLQITDSKGQPVETGQDGVGYFRGKENPIEVMSVVAPRLSDDVKNGYWTISSTTPVTVLVDREGSYGINFISPTSAPSGITNVYKTIDRQTPSGGITITFNLLDNKGNPIQDVQQISGQIITPAGQSVALSDVTPPEPGSDGVYTVNIDVTQLDPEISSKPGRFTFVIDAGSADEQAQDQVPIASARLVMDVGRTPYIRNTAPQPLICRPDWQSQLRVAVGDYDVTTEDKIQIAVKGGGKTVPLTSDGAGNYSADLTSLCQVQIAQLSCGAQQTAAFTVALDASLEDGTVLPTLEKDLPVDVNGVACTPTPWPTASPTLGPTPTPVPDRDGDGVNDLVDRCPDTWGLPGDNGCLPLAPILWAAEGLVLVGAFARWGWPWIKVRTVSAPPVGYLLACRDGVSQGKPVALYEAGMARRTDRVKIGGDKRRADIYIEGLQPVEFVVERRASQVGIRDPHEREPFDYFDDEVRNIRTSDPRVILRICLDASKIKCE